MRRAAGLTPSLVSILNMDDDEFERLYMPDDEQEQDDDDAPLGRPRARACGRPLRCPPEPGGADRGGRAWPELGGG
jgi:hypothetical protein